MTTPYQKEKVKSAFLKAINKVVELLIGIIMVI